MKEKERKQTKKFLKPWESKPTGVKKPKNKNGNFWWFSGPSSTKRAGFCDELRSNQPYGIAKKNNNNKIKNSSQKESIRSLSIMDSTNIPTAAPHVSLKKLKSTNSKWFSTSQCLGQETKIVLTRWKLELIKQRQSQGGHNKRSYSTILSSGQISEYTSFNIIYSWKSNRLDKHCRSSGGLCQQGSSCRRMQFKSGKGFPLYFPKLFC